MEKIKRIIFVSTLKLFLMMSVCNNHSIFAQSKSKKIVGLLQIRNESVLIEQCLHALSFYTDAMVILDDASQDDTVKLCKECAHTYRIEAILQNETKVGYIGLSHRINIPRLFKLLPEFKQAMEMRGIVYPET